MVGHARLKPSCIFLEWSKTLVVGFEGLVSNKRPVELEREACAYLCPEWRVVALGDTVAADVFALGAVMLHMARLWLPYSFHTSNISLLTGIIAQSISELNYSNVFKDLLRGMLTVNPAARISLKTVLSRVRYPKLTIIPQVRTAQARIAEPGTFQVTIMNFLPEAQKLVAQLTTAERQASEEVGTICMKLFDLYCSYGAKVQAENLADKVRYRYRITPNQGIAITIGNYQQLICTAVSHGLFCIAKSLAAKLLEHLPGNAYASASDFAYCYNHLATLNSQLGCVSEARDAALQWIALIDTTSPQSAEMALIAATAASLEGDKRSCLKYAQLALATKESLVGLKNVDLLPVLSLLVEVTNLLQHYSLCKQYSQRLIAIKEEAHLPTSLVYRDYAHLCFVMQAYSEAKIHYKRFISSQTVEDAQSYEELAICCQRLGNYHAAEQYFSTLLGIMQRNRLCFKLSQSTFEALVETKLALGSKHEVADVCRRYTRMIKEVEGERSGQTLEALRIAQNAAEIALLPQLAEEFRLTRERYSSSEFNFIPLVKCLFAQGKLQMAEEACYEALTHYKSPVDRCEVNLILIQCSAQHFPLLHSLISTAKFTALSLLCLPASFLKRYPLAQKFASEVLEVDRDLVRYGSALKELTAMLESAYNDKFNSIYSQATAALRVLAQALKLQRQTLERSGSLAQAQAVTQQALLVAESLARGLVPRTSLTLARHFLTEAGRKKESAEEEGWTRLRTLLRTN